MEIVVVGATGFVGRNLVPYLAARGHKVAAVSRSGASVSGASLVVSQPMVTNPVGPLNFTPDCVIYLAAIAHRGKSDAEDLYSRVNHKGAIHWAEWAKSQGARRFVFLSSSKVHGDCRSEVVNEDTPRRATDPYSRSKIEAEDDLRMMVSNYFDVISLRPPVVVGPGAKGNILWLRRLALSAIPFPRPRSDPDRSVLSLPNLLSAIDVCATTDVGRSGEYLLADAVPISPAVLYGQFCEALGRKARFVTIPQTLFRAVDKSTQSLLGRRPLQALYCEFVLDSQRFSSLYDWTPSAVVADSISTLISSEGPQQRP